MEEYLAKTEEDIDKLKRECIREIKDKFQRDLDNHCYPVAISDVKITIEYDV